MKKVFSTFKEQKISKQNNKKKSKTSFIVPPQSPPVLSPYLNQLAKAGNLEAAQLSHVILDAGTWKATQDGGNTLEEPHHCLITDAEGVQ